MQMGPKEIARDYRTAQNKQKQIAILAELNQCPGRRIAEILVAEGEELPKKWQEILQKPERRSWKFPEAAGADGSASPGPEPETKKETVPEAVETPSVTARADTCRDTSLGEGGERATDRDLFDAVSSLLPDGSREEAAPEAVPEKQDEKASAEETSSGPAGHLPRARGRREDTAPGGISAEDLLRAACRLLGSALELEPDRYRTYSCGVLDLVHALTEE